MSDLPPPETFVAVIDRWPTMVAMAADIGTRQGVVNQWRNRDSIQAKWFPAIVGAARQRGFPEITHELLAEIAAKVAERRRLARETRRRRVLSQEGAPA